MANLEIMRLWSAALRSGEFEQGTGALARPAGGKVKHCCLGVLCELAIRAGVPVEKDQRENGTFEYDGRGDTLPESVREWAGLDSPSPALVAPRASLLEQLHWSAHTLNDSFQWSFDEIADAIDATFLSE